MTDAEMRELLKPPPLIPLSRADIQKKARIMMLQRSAHAEAEQRWMDDYVGRGVPRCCGAFTPSTRLVSIREGDGWSLVQI